ncbi:MAG: S1C family serine protease [Dissulfurimicrobium sp.]|uniref:S1C family serine protease n=1 Tax=Dissulfurimicrobium sp. TaxID=2022436 RepID=UPI00404AC0DD
MPVFFLIPLCWHIFCSTSAIGFTGEGQQITQLCQRVGKSIVNITSLAVTQDMALAPFPPKGCGSGFIIDYQGHVVTDAHIISDIHSIEVTFNDGRKWPARLMAVDPDTDIAVLQVLAPPKELEKFPPLSLGITKDISPGRAIIAFGNPYGLGYTVSCGVLQGPVRSVATPDGRVVDLVIQTDISINSGNTGGPLVDLSGRVIGMNTLIFTPTGQSSGTGFAISSEIIQNVVSQVVSKGKILRPWIGVKLSAVTPVLARVLNLPVEKGVMVTDVIQNSPAARAGMEGSKKELRLGNHIYPVDGDIIVAIDGKPMDSDVAVIRFLQTKEPGDDIQISFYRDRQLKTVKFRLEQRPQNNNKNKNSNTTAR